MPLNSSNDGVVRINVGNEACTEIMALLPMAGDYVMVRRAAIATLEQMTKEFGWRPDADRGETVSDDPDCQITWGALHDLHHAIVALPSTDYVMVPREATEAMIDAVGFLIPRIAREYWSAMLSAASPTGGE